MSKKWTTADIPNLDGKIIIVTGANSGIGFDTTLELARKGAQVVMACRSQQKADKALQAIKRQLPSAQVEVMLLDLASLDSVRQFAAAFKVKYDRLDVLVNNAGIMMVPYGETEDGFERQLGTNHLGHFALTGLLLGLLRQVENSRVVNVSSGGHRMGDMQFDNLMYTAATYSPTQAYGRSKLANLLFTYEMQRRLDEVGAKMLAVAAHPGASQSNLGAHLADQGLGYRLMSKLVSILAQSSAMGALPTLRAAVGEGVEGGDYYGPGGFMEMRGYPVKVDSSEASQDKADAQRLWAVSEELTGVRFDLS
ncbi:MAG TPA: oxidoreductase [Anaerolineae bacterium]|nr:oxidoreductase [Anaerolineae bacterium]